MFVNINPQEDAQRVVSLAPGWSKGHARLGAALLGCGRAADAAASYRRALELDPESEAHRIGLKQAEEQAAFRGAGQGRAGDVDDDGEFSDEG